MILCLSRVGLAEELIERSANEKPAWLTRPGQSDTADQLCFTGTTFMVPSFEEGRIAAINDVLNQINFYIGVQSENQWKIQQSKDATQTGVSSELRFLSRIRLQGLKVRELYYERWKKNEAFYFNVFVQVAMPRYEVEAEKSRVQKDQLTQPTKITTVSDTKGALISGREAQLLKKLQEDQEKEKKAREDQKEKKEPGVLEVVGDVLWFCVKILLNQPNAR